MPKQQPLYSAQNTEQHVCGRYCGTILLRAIVFGLTLLLANVGWTQTDALLTDTSPKDTGPTANALTDNTLTDEAPTDSELTDDTLTSKAPSQLQLQLLYIQNTLTKKLEERRSFGNRIEQANEQDKADIRRDAANLTTEINQLRTALESLAVGDADTSLFSSNANAQEKNWKEDVALIAQPVLESLKEITEKPRQIKELNGLIDKKQKELQASNEALNNLQTANLSDKRSPLALSINRIEHKWLKRKENAEQAIEIARIQLATLQGDQPLFKTIYDSLVKFLNGRGLTIALALAAALLVWAAVRVILISYRHYFVNKQEESSRTRYRLAKYSVHAFTAILVLIAVFIVFYERHDVLLLGLLILFIVGLALSARHLLPRYVVEARLLLNLGSCRERELVIYKGLPWRVESINMHSILRNPKLNGVIRLPLNEITKLYSRPVVNEHWFPTSKGDVILTKDDMLLEVLDQNPDSVELRKRGGEIVFVPSATFYEWEITNLTRSGSFGVSISFGIDYEHQAISLDEVPRLLRLNIHSNLMQTDLREKVQNVEVELEAAGESSLRYWVFVTMHSGAAKSYQRLQRVIHTACIETCTNQQWTIPFPHLSLVQKIDTKSINSDSKNAA